MWLGGAEGSGAHVNCPNVSIKASGDVARACKWSRRGIEGEALGVVHGKGSRLALRSAGDGGRQCECEHDVGVHGDRSNTQSRCSTKGREEKLLTTSCSQRKDKCGALGDLPPSSFLVRRRTALAKSAIQLAK